MLSDRLPLKDVPEGLAEFIDGVLMPYLTAGRPGKTVWCAQWREHPAAVHRLAGIWDSWTHLLADDDANLHTFLRDVLDYHLPMLTDSDRGVFAACKFTHTPHARIDRVAQPGVN